MKRWIFAAVLALGACMSQENMAVVEGAADRFFELQSTSQDSEIYADATPGFRAASNVADLTRLNNAVRAVRNCTAPTRDLSNWRSTQGTGGHVVIVTYRRQCDGGELVDTFTFQIVGGQALLHGYNVAGMALFPSAPAPAAEPAPEAPQPETTPAPEAPATTTN